MHESQYLDSRYSSKDKSQYGTVYKSQPKSVSLARKKMKQTRGIIYTYTKRHQPGVYTSVGLGMRTSMLIPKKRRITKGESVSKADDP